MTPLSDKRVRWLLQWEHWSAEVARTVTSGREAFLADRDKQLSLRYSVGGVGEMARRLNDDGISSDPDHGDPPWPWHAMAGLRNRISHYGEVDLQRLWMLATEELPTTVTYLRPLLDQARAYATENGIRMVGIND